MKKLLDSMKRIWRSLRNITSAMVRRVTEGTSSTIKAIGGAVGAATAFLVMLCIIALIAVAAIPYGLFGRGEPNKQQVTDSHCKACGVTEGVFVTDEQYNITLCKDCYIETHPYVAKD